MTIQQGLSAQIELSLRVSGANASLTIEEDTGDTIEDAILAAIVEFGGGATTEELAAHVTPNFPRAFLDRVIRGMEGTAGLVELAPDGRRVKLAPTGIRQLRGVVAQASTRTFHAEIQWVGNEDLGQAFVKFVESDAGSSPDKADCTLPRPTPGDILDLTTSRKIRVRDIQSLKEIESTPPRVRVTVSIEAERWSITWSTGGNERAGAVVATLADSPTRRRLAEYLNEAAQTVLDPSAISQADIERGLTTISSSFSGDTTDVWDQVHVSLFDRPLVVDDVQILVRRAAQGHLRPGAYLSKAEFTRIINAEAARFDVLDVDVQDIVEQVASLLPADDLSLVAVDDWWPLSDR